MVFSFYVMRLDRISRTYDFVINETLILASKEAARVHARNLYRLYRRECHHVEAVGDDYRFVYDGVGVEEA